MDVVLIFLEFWRSADKPKVTWNALYTTQKEGRNQWPAYPKYAVLHFTVDFTCQKYRLNPALLIFHSPSTPCRAIH